MCASRTLGLPPFSARLRTRRKRKKRVCWHQQYTAHRWWTEVRSLNRRVLGAWWCVAATNFVGFSFFPVVFSAGIGFRKKAPPPPSLLQLTSPPITSTYRRYNILWVEKTKTMANTPRPHTVGGGLQRVSPPCHKLFFQGQ